MKKGLKILAIIILIYSICLSVMISLFSFLNKSEGIGFWISFFENEFPVMVGALSMVYLVWLLLKSLIKKA